MSANRGRQLGIPGKNCCTEALQAAGVRARAELWAEKCQGARAKMPSAKWALPRQCVAAATLGTLAPRRHRCAKTMRARCRRSQGAPLRLRWFRRERVKTKKSDQNRPKMKSATEQCGSGVSPLISQDRSRLALPRFGTAGHNQKIRPNLTNLTIGRTFKMALRAKSTGSRHIPSRLAHPPTPTIDTRRGSHPSGSLRESVSFHSIPVLRLGRQGCRRSQGGSDPSSLCSGGAGQNQKIRPNLTKNENRRFAQTTREAPSFQNPKS